MNKYTANIRRHIVVAASIEEVQDAYCTARDESGDGASTFASVNVYHNLKNVGKIYYNGRFAPARPILAKVDAQ